MLTLHRIGLFIELVNRSATMPLLIDGYNLLHASDIVGEGRPGRTSLERSRTALLEFLATHVPEKERAGTTIVFDSAGAPPGLPREQQHEEMQIRFAPRRQDADAVIEQILETHREPKRLLVVSSDHRIQRAARQRGAKSIDSEVWYAQTVREKRRPPAAAEEKKPPPPTSKQEVARWVEEFSDDG